MPIEFKSETQTATFYNPLDDFRETAVEIEIRDDPLTGRQTRIVPDAFVEPEESPVLPHSVTDGEGCFFCPETVTEATPTYSDFVGFDRGSVGEATSFPNLNPYGSHSNVVVLTEDHYVPIDELTATIFENGFRAALEYVERVFDADRSASVASINMNFLPTAGSSIIHPHIQTLVDDRGTNAQKARFDAVEEFRTTNDRQYFDDLLAKTRGTDRYIGSTGEVDWYAPFAPIHHRHVRGIGATTGLVNPDSSIVSAFATGIERVLAQYTESGLNSFNFTLHLADVEAIPPHIDIVARSVFQEYAWSDATFFETIHEESIIDVAPETYAIAVADRFSP